MSEMKVPFEELFKAMHDTARPMPDRVLACFYALQKAKIETEAEYGFELEGIGPWSARDVAVVLDIEPLEVVEAAIVDLQSRGLLASERPTT